MGNHPDTSDRGSAHVAEHDHSGRERAAASAHPTVGELPAQTDLLHERHEVIHQVLLDDLAFMPLRDRVEVDLE